MLNGLEAFNEAVWHGAPAPAQARPQSAAQTQQTFIRGMLEMPLQKENRNPAELVASLLFHVLIVAAVIIAPLLFTRTIDLSRLENTFLIAPPPPPPAAPPAQAEKVLRAVARPIPQQAVTQPVLIPAKIRIVHEAPPPDPGTIGVIGGVPGGIPGGVLGGGIGGTSTLAPPPPPPARHQNEILRVGGDVKPPQVIYSPAPVYPPLARTTHTEGVVIIDAVIDPTGHVVEARAISGPGLLMEAALDAVSKWRYQPTYLDGQAVSIRMHVTVKFHLE